MILVLVYVALVVSVAGMAVNVFAPLPDRQRPTP